MSEIKSEIKTENFKFFQHRECEFFPCHQGADERTFNCLFCYCPLFALGEDCGGNFVYMENGYKDCSNCTLPHRPENYDYICGRYGDILEIAKKNR